MILHMDGTISSQASMSTCVGPPDPDG